MRHTSLSTFIRLVSIPLLAGLPTLTQAQPSPFTIPQVTEPKVEVTKPTVTEDDVKQAMLYIHTGGASQNLPVFLTGSLLNTVTMRMFFDIYSKDKVVPVLEQHIREKTRKYIDKWEYNLALAHLQVFTVEEIKQQSERKFRYSPEQKPRVEKAGIIMKEMSEKFLGGIAGEVLNDMNEQLKQMYPELYRNYNADKQKY